MVDERPRTDHRFVRPVRSRTSRVQLFVALYVAVVLLCLLYCVHVGDWL